MLALAIHGGAGGIPQGRLTPQEEVSYRAGLAAALHAGYEVLERGGSSLDAVTSAVRVLEDDPQFNAARGATLTRDGWAELDASVMEGREQRAGAVACVRHIKNPIDLARRVMEKSRHVLLVGAGAEEFALEESVPLVPNLYFRTPQRLQQLQARLEGAADPSLDAGTVGAVARDVRGDLAAATSTGGMALKRHGRVGDSPLIGAGTYAKNGVCAVSATGHGEFFIRAVAAHHVSMSVEYRGLSLTAAVHETLYQRLAAIGGRGGIIAVDAQGTIVMEHSSASMFRAARDARGRDEVAIY
ncbi:MAG TPA: isoaspartyl peptidase/L-asparaginase [Steroidobacteraceae bacterium]|nr:isoaspartyl peptidase/L-asparaginase [Steroidobacteraceae bacterium]